VHVEEAATGDPGTILSGPLRATSFGLLTLITLIAFEAMAVAAALPTAARDVHGLAGYGWAFTGFLVANIVGMVAAGQISDARGPRPPLVAGLVCFLAGLVLAGTATTMVQLVAGRIVQGLGGGLMIVAIYVIIGQVYPARLRPVLFAAISSAWLLPSLVGPALSGALTEHASWRWVFLGLVPFTVVGGYLVAPTVRGLSSPETRGSLADPSRLLRALAVAAGVAALEQVGQHPSAPLAVVAVAALAAIVWGLRGLLPPGTYRVRPGVAAPVALRGLLAGAVFGIEAVVPLALQEQHGYSATAAGLPLTASGVGWALGSWWQGREVPGAGLRRRITLLRAGFALVALSAVAMAFASVPSVPGWLAYPAWFVSGLGAGFSMSTVGVLLLNYTTDATRGADSAALQLSDATSCAITTGLAGVLVAAAARGALSATAGFVVLDLAMCAVAIVGGAVAGRARPAEAAVAVAT
jgi:MFS family permease